MKVLGLDVGDKTIGIAVSDALFITAQGRKTIFRKSNKETIDEIIDIIVDDEIDKIVVGFPKNMNNTVGPQAIKTEKFMEKVLKKIKYTTRVEWYVEVIYFDERLSSKSAERVLLQGDVRRADRKKVIDKLAAVFILQNYLDSL